MDERQADILNTVVREFIKTGNPVGSKLLFEDHDFGVSSALIRAELHHLMEMGYLSQPHTSGGRVPTDKGYRYYIEVISDEIPSAIERETQRLENVFDNFENACRDMVNFLSDNLGQMSVGYKPEPGSVYKRGLESLIKNLETDDREEIVKIVSVFENMDSRFSRGFDELPDSGELPRVFVGKENPFIKSSEISIIYDSCDMNGDEFAVLIVGPRRMNYKRSMTLLGALKNKIREQN